MMQLCQCSALLCSHSCLWGHPSCPCSPGAGTASHHSPEAATRSFTLTLPQELGQQLLDANPVLPIFMCAVKPEELYSVTPGLIRSSMLSSPTPPPYHSSPIFFKEKRKKKKRKGRKPAFWCWVSGYGIIQIQHLPLSYVVPKGQYLTLLLPITLCTCRGLWYYCKTL